MPSPPEIRNAFSAIRIIEIGPEIEAPHFSEADGLSRLSAEITINLKGIGKNSQPG